MNRSIELLDKALTRNPNQSYWCNELGFTRNVLSNAKQKGRLSPPVALKLARALGESPNDTDHWVAVAALEQDDPTLIRLLRKMG
jgi:hypothetical protein